MMDAKVKVQVQVKVEVIKEMVQKYAKVRKCRQNYAIEYSSQMKPRFLVGFYPTLPHFSFKITSKIAPSTTISCHFFLLLTILNPVTTPVYIFKNKNQGPP